MEEIRDDCSHLVHDMKDEVARLTNETNRLASAIHHSHVTVYIDNHNAFIECIKLAHRDDVISLRNTIFRHGINVLPYAAVNDYDKWIDAKRNLLNRGKRVQELFDFNVPEYPLCKEKIQTNSQIAFDAAYLTTHNMDIVEMTIFKYTDNSRELLLGWSLQKSPREPVFRKERRDGRVF